MTIRAAASYAGLAVVLAGSFLGLTQCRMVGDRLTGVAAGGRRVPVSCVAQCQAVANQDIRTESEFHVLQVKACKGDPVCLALEQARHGAAVDSIQAKRRQCVEECHHQGSGGAGQ